MKHILFISIIFSIFFNASANKNKVDHTESDIKRVDQTEVTFSVFPLSRQVFPRDSITNQGNIIIRGNVTDEDAYTEIAVKLYREGKLYKSYSQQLVYNNDLTGFAFTIPIKAELANYSIACFGVKNDSPFFIKGATDLLAGDAFIIQGQSNAESVMTKGSSNEENSSNFIRVYGSGGGKWNKQWNIANGDVGAIGNNEGNTGQWGLRLAKRLMDSTHIPMVVFNGAHGGKPITWFNKKADSTNNYAFLLKRVYESGFINNIRAIFWYQGESDSNPGNSISVYKESFFDLYKAWKKDYKGFQRLYIIQIKQSCFSDAESNTKIQEAHRQLADEIPEASIFATNGITHHTDQCHYAYENGYKKIGDFLFSIVNRDFRNLSGIKNIESPLVNKVEQTAANKLTLYFKNKSDTYYWEPGTETDFVVHGVNAQVISGVVDGASVILTLSKNIKVDSLSFYGHMVGGSPCIRNAGKAGMVGFYKLQVKNATAPKVDFAPVGLIKIEKLYPVPTRENLIIKFKLYKTSTVIFTVQDISGKKYLEVNDGFSLAGDITKNLNVSILKKGLYVLQLQTNSGISEAMFNKE